MMNRDRIRTASNSFALAVALASAIGMCGIAAAQTAPDPETECEKIPADADRLECYDRRSGRPTAKAGTSVMPALEVSEAVSLIDKKWGFERDSRPYIIDLHDQNYFLFARHTTHVNNAPYSPAFQVAGQQGAIDDTEAKFQISLKARLWTSEDRGWGVWVAYTQQSNWQLYNQDISRPFRETNYMPELLVSYRPDLEWAGFRWRLLNVGFNHQSNGRSDPLSRSWNRFIAEAGVERGSFALLLKAWYRIKENPAKDDNPDITDYYGHGSLTAIYKLDDHSFSLMGRGNFTTGKGAAQLTWTSARFLGPLRAYVQGFTGYGESLIDYNWKQSTIGIGIALNDAL